MSSKMVQLRLFLGHKGKTHPEPRSSSLNTCQQNMWKFRLFPQTNHPYLCNISNNNDADTEVVFEYTGKGCAVPKNVTSVRFHPSVIEVEDEAFKDCKQLGKLYSMRVSKRLGSMHFIIAHHYQTSTFLLL